MEGLQRMPSDGDSRSQSILLSSFASSSPTLHPHQQQNSSNSLSCSAHQICGFSQSDNEGNSSNLCFGSLDVRNNTQNPVLCNLDSNGASLMLLDASNSSTALAFFPIHSVLPFSSSHDEHVPPIDQQRRVGSAAAERKRKKRKRIETTFTTLINDKPPVAPSSAYLLFCKEKRSSVRRENPELTFSELTKALGAQWSGMSAVEKQMFFEKSSVDKERYKREFEIYQANNNLASASTPPTPSAGLYCASCELYFNTSFNKEQHLQGKRHRLALIRSQRLSNKRLDAANTSDRAPLDMETALFDFCHKVNERECEIKFLIDAVQAATGRIFDLETKRQQLANTLEAHEQQLRKLDTVIESMSFEKRNLSMSFQTLT